MLGNRIARGRLGGAWLATGVVCGDRKRFASLTKKIERQGKSAAAAKAIAAAAGRKKYGAKKMARMAAKGRRK